MGWMAFVGHQDRIDVMEEMVQMAYQGRLGRMDEISTITVTM